jgi:predicted acetyltransferase
MKRYWADLAKMLALIRMDQQKFVGYQLMENHTNLHTISTYPLMQFILFQPFQIEQIALLITTLNRKSSNNT